MSRVRVRVRRPLLALVALVAALAVGYTVRAVQSDNGTSGPTAGRSSSVAVPSASTAATPLSALPAQVAQTVTLIRDGGPFPYPRNDGAVFHNSEHLLPQQADGYYREYTVPTPGSPDRGPRRLVTGRGGEYYYTADHYEHFILVDVAN